MSLLNYIERVELWFLYFPQNEKSWPLGQVAVAPFSFPRNFMFYNGYHMN